jgi:hypothetical protein
LSEDGSLSEALLKHFAIAVTLFMLTPTPAGAQTDPLAELRWKNRILVMFAVDTADPKLMMANESLEASVCELADRDMVIGVVLERGQSRMGAAPIDSRTADQIRSRLRVKGAGFAAVLVGKDGGVKARYRTAPPLEEVFALIDGMPMRRAEQRQRDSRCDTR